MTERCSRLSNDAIQLCTGQNLSAENLGRIALQNLNSDADLVVKLEAFLDLRHQKNMKNMNSWTTFKRNSALLN